MNSLVRFVKAHRVLVAVVCYVASSLVWGPAAEAHMTPNPAIVALRQQVAARRAARGIAYAPRAERVARPAAPAAPAVAAVAVVAGSSRWDCIAKYESGGNWASTDGMYEGGLQFLPSTWAAAGGTRYAPHAYQASKAQQVAVAESWLAKTSWNQWPQTSRRCGYR